VLPSSAGGAQEWCTGRYERSLVPHAGHFLPEEAPQEVSERLVRWLDALRA
jgi:hypothetical protein